MLPARIFAGKFGVCNGSADEIVITLGLLGASPGESSGPIKSGLGFVGGDTVLTEAVEACGLLGGASNFPSLAASAAPSSFGDAATVRLGALGARGTLVHKGVAPARGAEGSEGERASSSEGERLQYRGQGAARS